MPSVVVQLVCADGEPSTKSPELDLFEVIALAEQGKVKPRVERFPLTRVREAYRELREGRIQGRAVIVPEAHAS